MNNTFYDEENKIEYIIPADRQLERNEAEVAVQNALESYAESALAQYLRRYPETAEDKHNEIKADFRRKRVLQQRGSVVLIHAQFTSQKENNEK